MALRSAKLMRMPSPVGPHSSHTPRTAPVPASTRVSERLSRVRQRDTRAEMQIRSRLHAQGLRYRVDVRPLRNLRRRADVVFPRARVAVFVDGCFWHGCPTHATWPRNNAAWWKDKIEQNRRRDRDTDRALEEAGWTVVRVWEHEQPDEAAELIANVVRDRL